MKTKTKEEALEIMKKLVVDLKEGQIFTGDGKLQAWKDNREEMGATIKQLNSCDMLWLEEKYGAWFRKTFPGKLTDKITDELPDLSTMQKDASDSPE